MQGEFGIQQRVLDGAALDKALIALRWVVAAAYITLARTGALDMSDRALLLTGGALCLYHVFYTWQRLSGQADPRFLTASRYIDIMLTTMVVIAIRDVENPIWALYFVSIVAVAHLLSPRQMLAYAGWTVVNYVGAALAIAALGGSVSVAYVAVVSVLVLFMGLNAVILAGGEQRLREVIARVAITDSLTGLPNRRCFQEVYSVSVDDAIARRLPLTLMLVDVDFFKQINDTRGHPAGDDKLRELAQAFGDTMRRADVVARYGGDEFIIIAPETNRVDGLGLAERLRLAAASCGIGVSIGVALFPDDAQQHDALIAAADRALYAAKEAGRNCVRSAA